MKNIKIFLLAFIAGSTMLFQSCESDDVKDLTAAIEAPSEVDVIFSITQDNTGLVTLSPSGKSVSSFEVFFEDGTGESAVLALGENAERNYPEGSFPVRVVATNLSGQTTEVVKNLTVSFRAPENLNVTVTRSASSNFGVTVTATADFETAFEVTFGEDPNMTPVTFMENDVVTYEYSEIGSYTITVRALSGGNAITESAEEVIIENPAEPVMLPLDYESTTIDYNLGSFEAIASIVDNPDMSAGNNSTKVVSIEKTGNQVFGGVGTPLTDPIDFSGPQNFRMKTWSPMPIGTKVTMKFENADRSYESPDFDSFTTKSSDWETLFFDTTGLDLDQAITRVVVFFDLGNTTTGDVNYFDDIQLADGPPVLLPLTFEDDRRQYDIGTNNGGFSIVENPVSGPGNMSGTVGQFDRPAIGGNNFALVAIVVDEPLSFDASTSYTLKVYSPRAGLPIWLKFEQVGNNSQFQEVTTVTTTVANQWETLTFENFTGNATENLRNVVIFFDPLGATDNPETIYIDDLIKTN